jgi:hypothetical protein
LVVSLKDYLVANKDELTTYILRGKYRPNPVRREKYPRTTGRKGSWGLVFSLVGVFWVLPVLLWKRGK